jgi:excisionase family DNA binding protein
MTQIVDPAQREPTAFNIRDGAAYLGVGETLFRQLLRAGTISHRKAGRRVIVSKAALDRFLGAA